MITETDWLCARYPGLSESLIVAVCSEYDNETLAERHLRSISLDSPLDPSEGEENVFDDVSVASDHSWDQDEYEKPVSKPISLLELSKTWPPESNPSFGWTITYPKEKKGKKNKKKAKKDKKKRDVVEEDPKMGKSEINKISTLLSCSVQKAEDYHRRYKSYQRTILELILSVECPIPSAPDLEIAENTQAVFMDIPWDICVRLCSYFNNGSKAFEVAEQVASFKDWDLLNALEAETEPAKEEIDQEFTPVGDKACAEKVRAAMVLSKESKMYEELQQQYKQELMNTTDPRLRMHFQRELDTVKDQIIDIKGRITTLTTPRNESTWYIDLHGLYVPDAMKVAQVKIDDWWAVEKSSKNVKPLMLNTGLGSHSPGGYSKIKVVLDEWLGQNRWKHEVHRGHIEVLKKI